jgi:hypothetical protein
VFASGSATVPATPVAITGSPIIPPPPIGDPVGVPVFPPATGQTAPVPVPLGPLVGPAIAPAAVPPSCAGVPQPQFGSGNPTTPPGYFTSFTTTPPSPPIVFANVAMIGNNNPPPSTPGQTPPPVHVANEPAASAPPVSTSAPVLSGTPTVGDVLSVTVGNWNNEPTAYGYQWLRGATPIQGASASTYTLATADVGDTITAVVTATNVIGSASATSNGIGPVAALGEDPAARSLSAAATRKRRTR